MSLWFKKDSNYTFTISRWERINKINYFILRYQGKETKPAWAVKGLKFRVPVSQNQELYQLDIFIGKKIRCKVLGHGFAGFPILKQAISKYAGSRQAIKPLEGSIEPTRKQGLSSTKKKTITLITIQEEIVEHTPDEKNNNIQDNIIKENDNTTVSCIFEKDLSINDNLNNIEIPSYNEDKSKITSDYEQPIEINHNSEKYIKIFFSSKIEAENGNTRAQFRLSNMYMKGEGVEKDILKAIEWCEKAAEGGHEKAKYLLEKFIDNCYLINQEKEKYIASITTDEDIDTTSIDAEESAETSIATIEANDENPLGKIDSADSEFIEEDKQQEEIEHQPIDDEQNHADTLFALGINYLEESDNNKAHEYLLRAAELGHAEAQYTLGLYYELRQGDTTDSLQAYHWFRQSAGQGYADACYKVGLYHLPNNLSAEEKCIATTWFISAAKAKHAEGAYYAALSYITGVNNELTDSDAISYLEQASEAGMVEATYLLGICHRDGAYATSDKEKACYLFEKAAECCHAESEYQLGQCYEFGQGTTQNHRKALYWYERAAKHGNADAEKHLKSLLWVARKIKLRINMCEE